MPKNIRHLISVEWPSRLFLVSLGSVFVGELLIMLLLDRLLPPTRWAPLLDPVLLSLAVLPILYFCVFRPLMIDVAQRREAERRLAEQNRFLNSVLESLTHPFYVIDAHDYTIKMANSAARLGEIGPHSTCYELTHHFDVPCHERGETCPIQQVLDGGKPAIVEHLHYDHNGNARVCEVHAYPLRNAAGEVTQIIEYSLDITARKQAEYRLAMQAHLEQLRADTAEVLQRPGETRALLQAVAALLVERLDAAFTRVWTLNPDGQTLELQASAGLYTHVDGPHRRVAVGQFKIGMIAQERRPHVTNRVLGDPRVHDQQWAEREGLVAFAGYPLVLEDRLLGVVALFARHELSPAAVETFGAVSNLLAQALARKQAEEDLRRAKEATEEASRAKDHFLAVLSHELRTPLTPVLALLSLMERDSELPPGYREDVVMVRRNVVLEARLIDDLLDVTRIARGKVELNRRPVALCDVLRHAVEVCQADIEARALHFGVDAGRCSSCIVYADAARLQQVFWNLLKNAVKFTPHGGCVGVCCGSDGHGNVVVEVKDSGVGIDPAMLPRLFKPFEQGGAGVTRRFGGLGLGLAITKGLVEMHGGSITVQSEGKDKGTTVRVQLPLHETAESGGAEGVQRAPGVPTAHRLRILLVEDHGDTARMVRRILAAAGHEVQTAGDVATALELAGSQHFDLLVSDLGLPDGSGLDLMRTLKARGRSLPSIALSGYGQEQDVRQSRAAGFAEHLTKPVEVHRLYEAVGRVVAVEAGSA